MRGVATDPARELYAAIERLPLATCTAMLDAARCPATRLIAGGYAARGGGVCPLLAAHRRGGRTHDASCGVSAFAGAWDRYTGTPTGDPRPIHDAERRTLEVMLVESLRERTHTASGDLVERVALPEAERLGRGARAGVAGAHAPPDADRTAELSAQAGWAWLGVFRAYDDYRAALLAVGEGGAAPSRDEGQPAPIGV